MDRIVVGIDGSPAALDALRWSADLAGRSGTELVAARVFETTQAELPPDDWDLLHDRQRDELDDWCRSLADDAAPARALLLDGDPADALLGAAGHEGADLLVVGGRGAGGFVHLHLGSVAHHLTHHTTVPLAIVPTSGAAAVRHLVVGLDGSPGSACAAGWCADLGRSLGVAVTAVHAFEPFAEWVPTDDPRNWRRFTEQQIRRWAAPIDEAGVTLEIDVDRDVHPVAAMARALGAHPGALAVVGTRGLGGFSGLRLGRVPLQLVHETGAAVVLVPPPPEP